MASAWVVPMTWEPETYPGAVEFNRELRDQFNHVKYFPYAASALATDRQTTATTFTAINTALTLIFQTYGGYIKVGLMGAGDEHGGLACYDVTLNGTRVSPSPSGAAHIQNGVTNASFTRFATAYPSGVYTAQAVYRADPGGATAVAVSGMLLWAMEVP